MKHTRQTISQSLDGYHGSQIPKLVGTLFRGAEHESTDVSPARLFTVTSPQEGEGVTTISLMIARELARHPERETALASTAELAQLTPADVHSGELWSKEPQTGLWRLAPVMKRETGVRAWETDPRFVRDLLEEMRRRFGAVILDCGSLLSSPDLPKLGHLVDGAIVVIEAGRSTRPQIDHALEVLFQAGAELKGFVLNRRTYPIPERVYRWLRS